MVLGKVLIVAGFLLTGGSAFGVGIYAADYEVVATVVDKQCAGPVPPGFEGDVPDQPDQGASEPSQPSQPTSDDASFPATGENSTVTVRLKVFGIPFEIDVTDFPNDKCWPLRDGEDGNFVTVNIRTQRAIFFEREGGPCIFHTTFGPGCVLPELAGTDTLASASFVLSTSGYNELGIPLPPAPNCLIIPAEGATQMNIDAAWESTLTDGSLRLVVEVLVGAEVRGSAEVSGPSVLTASVGAADADEYRIALYPTTEPIGTTSGIVLDIDAFGIDTFPSASPTPCP